MSTILNSGTYRIICYDGDRPTGITSSRVPHENIRLDDPIQAWRIERHGDIYRLRIDGFPYTGVIDGMVTASHRSEDDREWRIFCGETGCTIELDGRPCYGWTVAPENSINPRIIMEEIESCDPDTIQTQRFRFQLIKE